MFLLSILAVILFISLSQVPGEDRFAASIHHYSQPYLNRSVYACGATVITSRHVLTTARCVDVSHLSLEVAVEVGLLSDEAGGYANETRKVGMISVSVSLCS